MAFPFISFVFVTYVLILHLVNTFNDLLYHSNLLRYFTVKNTQQQSKRDYSNLALLRDILYYYAPKLRDQFLPQKTLKFNNTVSPLSSLFSSPSPAQN